MADKHPLQADKRTVTGRKVKTLRKQEILPANIFGSKVKSTAIQLPVKDFLTTYKEVGDTGVIDLTVKGETKPRPVLVHLIHTHPVTDLPLHVDFRQVDLKEKITAEVPLELIGESPAVDQHGGILVQVMDSIEVEALPTDLPEKLELDITAIAEIGGSLHVSDLKTDKKVTLQSEPETLVVKVEAPKAEEEKPEPKPEEGEEAEGKEKKKEGEEEKKEGEEGKKAEEKKGEDQKPAEEKPSPSGEV